MTRFQIFRDQVGKFRWRLVSGNNEIVAVSEGYTSKQNAIRSAQNVKFWASSATIVDLA